MRKILTTRGWLAIKRTVLRPTDSRSKNELLEQEGVKSIVPLDIAFKIDMLPYKMTRQMMCELAYWGQKESSFKAAQDTIKKIYEIDISIEQIRDITNHVGRIIYEDDIKRADEIYNNMIKLNFQKAKRGIFYGLIDGGMVNTRTKDEAGSTWKEDKLGMVFSSDNIYTTKNKKGELINRIQKREYATYLGGVEGFKKLFFACAVKNGYGQYDVTVILSDGSHWIRNMCEELFPDAVLILDLFHLKEKIYEYAKYLYPNDEAEYTKWAEIIIEKIERGQVNEVLKIISAPIKELPKGIPNLKVYIQNNIDRINYPEYKAKGYYIGSGPIESGHKSVNQARMKLPGMMWNVEIAQYLLTLRAKYKSNLWQEIVNTIMNYDFMETVKK